MFLHPLFIAPVRRRIIRRIVSSVGVAVADRAMVAGGVAVAPSVVLEVATVATSTGVVAPVRGVVIGVQSVSASAVAR